MDQRKKSVSDWKCIRNLGQGSFGVVELWKNSRSGRLNAVKRFELRTNSEVSEKTLEEFKKLWRKEVELMSNITDCPYIVAAEPLPQDLPVTTSVPPTLFMEYCNGGNLRSVLKLPENICGLKENEGLTILDHLSKAVTFLHNMGIVHRDLKPDNILRQYDSSNRVTYKLSDLGFAKDVSKSQNQCTTFVGTPQYLAPEIYMGKAYDKTVDYWSFGIIAFEIMCGLRPFLHGESPSNWLPLVEEKSKDVICIYRNGEGKIVLSSTIPYYTHFSDVMKECLTAWLRTMLQLDPARRGHKITEGVGANDTVSDVVDLKLLNSTLATKFLEIQTIKERMAFPIGVSGHTKISDIQQRIAVKTGLIQDNQLILTMDGVEVQKTDLASKFIGMDLYLIPRSADLIRLRVKFPKTVNNFILQWDSMKDPTKLRKVWACAIYFFQAELQKVDIMKKTIEALKLWCISNYSNPLKALRIEIEKAGSSLGTILELEGRLEAIDLQYSSSTGQPDANLGGEDKIFSNVDTQSGSRYWTEEMSKLHNHYSSCFDHWIENVALKPVRTTGLEELYHKILRACSDWKSSDTNSPPFSYNEILVRSVCQFIVQRNDMDDLLLYNIRVQLEKMNVDSKLMDDMKSVVTKLSQFTFDVMQQRCLKQTTMVQKLNGTDLPVSLESVSVCNPNCQRSSSALSNNSTSRSPNPNSVRGGGYRTPSTSKRMCQSALPTAVAADKENASQPSTTMSISLNTGLKNAIRENCPLLNRLMNESQILKDQTEEKLRGSSDSMEEIKEIMKEKESIKWDFLHN